MTLWAFDVLTKQFKNMSCKSLYSVFKASILLLKPVFPLESKKKEDIHSHLGIEVWTYTNS